MDEEITSEQIWRDLIAAHAVKKPPPGAMTAFDFSEKTGLSVSRSRDILNGKVRDGVLRSEKFQAQDDGRGRPLYYWPVEQ